MKVLGLIGSGRKDGNTNTLADKILEGAKMSGHETNKLFLADLKISPIGDCIACQKAGRCNIEDDFDALMEKVLESDCVETRTTPCHSTNVLGSVPKVVEKGTGMSYPIEKQNK